MGVLHGLLCLLIATLVSHVDEASAVEIGKKDWWQTTVFYQIYPRSYKDSDDDGIGDLNGIRDNLQHFVNAGIGAVWLSPIFKSPMVDFGYDISDYRQIDPTYGSMQDFEDLVTKAHDLGLKVILDFVPNHCSNESDYFKLSLNKTEGYEDFFIWDDGLLDPSDNKTRLPPSNWVSQFQGSAWEWNEQRGQYYLHQFSVSQVDFNFRNPKVLAELKSIMTFYLDKGVDGFRIDALPYLVEASKEQNGGKYPDDPLSGAPGFGPDELGYTIPIYSKDLDETYDIVYDWRDFLDEYAKKDGVTRVMMTEGYANITRTMKYYGTGKRDGSSFPFNFDLITNVNGKSSGRDMVYTLLRWLTYMPVNKTANWVLGNHDNLRMASRFGPQYVDGLNMLDMILPGVAITYQGDEIGMPDGYVSYRDTVDVSGCTAGPDDYTKFSRDPARTPFQWNNSTNAGFSNATKTWLPVGQSYKTLNLDAQMAAPKSHFKVFQKMVEARKQPTLQDGDWSIKPLSDAVFVVLRTLQNYDSYALVFNFGSGNETADLSQFTQLANNVTVYASSVNSTKVTGSTLNTNAILLSNGEAVVITSGYVKNQ